MSTALISSSASAKIDAPKGERVVVHVLVPRREDAERLEAAARVEVCDDSARLGVERLPVAQQPGAHVVGAGLDVHRHELHLLRVLAGVGHPRDEGALVDALGVEGQREHHAGVVAGHEDTAHLVVAHVEGQRPRGCAQRGAALDDALARGPEVRSRQEAAEPLVRQGLLDGHLGVVGEDEGGELAAYPAGGFEGVAAPLPARAARVDVGHLEERVGARVQSPPLRYLPVHRAPRLVPLLADEPDGIG